MANVTVPVRAGADHDQVGRLTLTDEAMALLLDGGQLSYEYVRQDGKPRLLAVDIVAGVKAIPPDGLGDGRAEAARG